jgi:hypothetical protein
MLPDSLRISIAKMDPFYVLEVRLRKHSTIQSWYRRGRKDAAAGYFKRGKYEAALERLGHGANMLRSQVIGTHMIRWNYSVFSGWPVDTPKF